MFCKQCGKELAESARFCPACGTPAPSVRLLKPDPPAEEQAQPAEAAAAGLAEAAAADEKEAKQPEKEAEKQGKPKKKVIVACILAAAVVVAAVVGVLLVPGLLRREDPKTDASVEAETQPAETEAGTFEAETQPAETEAETAEENKSEEETTLPVNVSAEPETKREPSTTAPVPSNASEDYSSLAGYYYTTDALNMRSGPGTTYPVVKVLPVRTRIYVTSAELGSDGRIWAFIYKEGYVCAEYLAPEGTGY